MSDYISALLREIEEKAPAFEGRPVTSVFFGGGTPSILPEEQIVRVSDVLRAHFTISEEAEITIEANPGTLTKEKLECYKANGINRLSIGVQSALAHELLLLGRVHRFEDAILSFELARKAGFTNINMDLIFGIPGQTEEDFKKSLTRVGSFRPEHISVYGLQIEEGTKFFSRYGWDDAARQRGETPAILPTEEAERNMYHLTKETLEKYGYRRYEISNFARRGHICRHNLGYWKRREYLGLGLGASSLIDSRRFHNTEELSSYINGDYSRQEEAVLSRRDEMAEMMILGLRLEKGVSREEFYDAFGVSYYQKYGQKIESLKRSGLLQEEQDHIFLTELGFDLANQAMGEFLE